MKMAKRKIWHGAYYKRGGTLKDKHGNVRREPTTFRKRKMGYIVTEKGTFIGIEPPRHHNYGQDPKKAKKPKGWHGESLRHSLARRKG